MLYLVVNRNDFENHAVVMRRIVLIFYILLLGCGHMSMVLSQEPYFKRTYPIGTSSAGFNALDRDDNRTDKLMYLSTTQSVTTGVGSHDILIALDPCGNIVDSSRLIIDSVFILTEGLFHLNDSIIILLGSISDPRLENRASVFTAHFNKHSRKYTIYRELRSYFSVMRQVVRKANGGYAGIGASTVAGYSQVCLYEFDSLGMLIHETTFGAPGWQDGWSIVELADGGYALGGWKRRGIGPHQDHYTIRVSPTGNVIWESIIPGQYGNGPCFLTVLKNGNLISTSFRNKENSFAIDPYAFELHGATGVPLWGQRFSQEYGSEFIRNPILDKDENIIAPGLRRVLSEATDQLVFHISLTKFKKGGELIWDRVYCFNPDDAHILTINPEVDSEGFIWFGGRAGEHPFLMKVDSLGCPFPDCDDVEVSIIDPDFGVGFEVMPNPVTDHMQVRYQNTGGVRNLELRIVDLKGSNVFHSPLNGAAPHGDVFLDTSRWIPGMYLVQVWVDGLPIRTEKVVKH